MIFRSCQYCGKPLGHGHSLFCGKACKDAWGGGNMKIKHCLHCGVEIPPDAGGYQAHRKMYCSPQCKDAATKARRRDRIKGLLPPHVSQTGEIEVECPECGKLFKVPDNVKGRARVYCSRECHQDAQRRKSREYEAERRKRRPTVVYQLGAWGLETDPWATGQLPAEIRRNALWA